MIIGKIVGTVVATRKHEALVGSKIQVVQVLNPDETVVKDQRIVAIDTVGAGPGELVILTTGTNAAKAADNPDVPVDAAITGIIDEIDLIE